MGPFEMVVAIVFLAIMGSLIGSLIKAFTDRRHGKVSDEAIREAEELRDQIITLEDRIRVLERIITESNSRDDLRRQFRDLERGRS